MKDELMPCPVPWCDHTEPPEVTKRTWGHAVDDMHYSVDCPSCGLETNDYPTAEKAITAWNTRPAATQGTADNERIEALEAIVERLLSGCPDVSNTAIVFDEPADSLMREARALLERKPNGPVT